MGHVVAGEHGCGSNETIGILAVLQSIAFVDGTFRTIDLGPKLASSVAPIFEPLRDVAYFSQVSVDPEIGTVVWPNGADIAPDVIHEGSFDEVAANR
jgi:hypothetical protein